MSTEEIRFRGLVWRMREAQKRYSRRYTPLARAAAEELQDQVDRELGMVTPRGSPEAA